MVGKMNSTSQKVEGALEGAEKIEVVDGESSA